MAEARFTMRQLVAIAGTLSAVSGAAGVNNAIAVNVSAGGAGSLAVGAISMTLISE